LAGGGGGAGACLQREPPKQPDASRGRDDQGRARRGRLLQRRQRRLESEPRGRVAEGGGCRMLESAPRAEQRVHCSAAWGRGGGLMLGLGLGFGVGVGVGPGLGLG
jgi:hypothetical protein